MAMSTLTGTVEIAEGDPLPLTAEIAVAQKTNLVVPDGLLGDSGARDSDNDMKIEFQLE